MLEMSYIFISGLKKKERFLSLCVNNSLSSYAGQLHPNQEIPMTEVSVRSSSTTHLQVTPGP